MSVHPLETSQEAEALFWLDLARRVLSGEVSPDEARALLTRNGPYSGRSGDDD